MFTLLSHEFYKKLLCCIQADKILECNRFVYIFCMCTNISFDCGIQWCSVMVQCLETVTLTSPLPSASNMSMTRCTRGFCCSSGSDMNSSMESAPELSRSSFRNRLPSRRISSASTTTTRNTPSHTHVLRDECLLVHLHTTLLSSDT